MTARNYKSTVNAKTLAATMNSSVTTMQLNDIIGIPSYPFTMVIDPDTALEEIVTVNSLSSGNTVNVTRGQDGTTSVGHDAGATIRHMITARDLQDAQDHIFASTNVHGLSGGAVVVGTSSSQTLTNKTLTNCTISGGSLSSVSGSLSSPAISNFVNSNHSHLTAATGGTLTGGSILYSRSDQVSSYTLTIDDNGKVVTTNNASANTLTVPPNSSVAFPIGTTITVVQLGAGQTTITPGLGVTINSETAKYKLRVQYAAATLYKYDTNTWVLFGNTAL
jgi:hypothetical protein